MYKVQHIMKPNRSTSSGCSCASCVSKNELASTQGEASNKETLTVRKRHPLKTKQKNNRTIENQVGQSFLSGSENSFQSDRYYQGVENRDAVERSGAVLDLVNLVNKTAILGPNRLSETCSCTTGSIVYQQDHNKKRRRPSSYHYASVRQRCGSNYTMSKKRSILMKTILNTKFTQSTPSQCTFKFKTIQRNQPTVKINYVSLHSTKQRKEHSPTREFRQFNEEHCAQSTPKFKKVVLPDNTLDQNIISEKDSNIVKLTNILSSLRFASIFNNSISDVFNSDLSSKCYISENFNNNPCDQSCFDFASRNNDIIDQSRGISDVRTNPVVVISASSLVATCSKLNLTWKNNTSNKYDAHSYNEHDNEEDIKQDRYSKKSKNQTTSTQFINDHKELHSGKHILQEKAAVANNYEDLVMINHGKNAKSLIHESEQTRKSIFYLPGQRETKMKHYSISSDKHSTQICQEKIEDSKKSSEVVKDRLEKVLADNFSPTNDYTHKHTNLKKKKRKMKSSESKSSKVASLGYSIHKNSVNNQVNAFDDKDVDRSKKIALKISEKENQIFVYKTIDTNKNGQKTEETTISISSPRDIDQLYINSKSSRDLNLKSTSVDSEKRSKLFSSIIKCFNSLTRNKKQLNTDANTSSNNFPVSFSRVDRSDIKMKNPSNLATSCMKNKSKQSIKPEMTAANKHDMTKYCQTDDRRNKRKTVSSLRSKLNLRSQIAGKETLKIHKHEIIEPKRLLDGSSYEVVEPNRKTSIKQKLKTYVSSFYIQKKCKTELSKATLPPTIKNEQFSCYKKETAKSKEADTLNSVSPYNYYSYIELLNKNKYSPLTYNTSIRKLLKYNSKIAKQLKDSYIQYAVEQEQLISSISDTQTFSDSAYNENIYMESDFTEDDFIYNAIKTAIKRQILKARISKFEYEKRNNRYFDHNQYIDMHTFPQELYAMNVYKLKPYECEPGVCVPNPDECDPHECLKLINRRVKKGASTGTPGTKSSSSYAPGYTGPRKRRKTQGGGGPYDPQKKYSGGYGYAGGKSFAKGVSYNKPPSKSKKRNTVRMGSSFSLDVEFSKGKTGGDARLVKKKRGLRKTQVGEQTPKRKLMNSSTSTVDPVKKGKLKRCFCTLKLQKKGKNKQPKKMNEKQGSSTTSTVQKKKSKIKLPKKMNEKQGSSTTSTAQKKKGKNKQPKKMNEKQGSSTPSTAQNTKRIAKSRQLDPHECEPNVCIPGSCDPYECLERKKNFRDRGFNAEPIATSTSGTDPGVPKRRQTVKVRPRGKSATTARERQKENSPHKQAVKIGSTFSFSLELYKNIEPTAVEIKEEPPEFRKIPGHPKETKEKIRGKKVGRASGPIMEYGVDRGAGSTLSRRRKNIYGLHDQGVESRLGEPVANRGTETLRHCFCTLKLHKHGKVPADQVKVVKEHGTLSDKYKCVPDCYSKGANTGKLLPYECEPGTCIPGECDPNECYKRIQARYLRETGTTTGKRGKKYRSHSTATIYKHAGTGRTGGRAGGRSHFGRQSRGFECAPGYCDVSQSITSGSVIEERRPILKKTRQAVRLGSDFKFNIEFFKDKTENKSVPISKLPPGFSKLSTFSRSPHRRGRKFNPVTCACPVVKSERTKEQKEGRNAKKKKDQKSSKSNTKGKRHGSTMTKIIKRCFCTMSLQKSKGKTQTVYTVFPDIQDPFQFIADESISVTTYSKSCDNSFSVIKGSCQRNYDTEKLLREVINQSEWSYSKCEEKNRCEFNPNLPYQNSLTTVNNDSVYYKDDELLKDKWYSVTGFRSCIQNSICAMRADTMTCGAKTCKKNPGPCNLPTCSKRARPPVNEKPVLEDTLKKNTEGPKPNEQGVGVDPKTFKEELKDAGITKSKVKKSKSRKASSKRKDVGKEDRKEDRRSYRRLHTTRVYPHANPNQKETDRGAAFVEESRFKTINDPFRQAVRITSSFTFNVEFSRDKLPDDLKLPDYEGPLRPREGISIQTRPFMPRMTERSIAIGAGQMGQRCPCAAKLEKVGIVEMKHKNMYANLPYQPRTKDKSVGTKQKFKSPYDCDPNMCYPELCKCYERKQKQLEKKQRKQHLRKRQSVQLGSKLSCNLEFFKDDTYSVGQFGQYGEQQSNNNKKPDNKQSIVPKSKASVAPKHRRNDNTTNKESTKGREQQKRTENTNSRSPVSQKQIRASKIRTENTNNRSPVSQKQIRASNVKTKESGVGPYLKKCFCTLKCQKQIVNYLSLDVKSPLTLEDKEMRMSRSRDRYYRNEERYLKSDSESDSFSQTDPNHYSQHEKTLNNDYYKQDENISEMETLYPYTPKKFNTKFSTSLLQTNHIKKIHHDKKYRRKSMKSKKCEESRNIFLGQGKVPRAQNYFRSFTRVFFKKPRHKDRQTNNITNRKKRRKLTKESGIDILNLSRHRNPKQDRKAGTLRVSKSDRRPVKSKAARYPKKSESVRPTYSDIRKTCKRNRHEEKKKKHYLSEESDVNLGANNRNNLSSRCQTITKDVKSKHKINLNPYLDNKQVYLSLVHNERPKIVCECPDKQMIPWFDMHLHAGDMNLLNKDFVYEKIMQLKRIQEHAHQDSKKIMNQLHGESCCCCVSTALRKQVKQENKNKEIIKKKQQSSKQYIKQSGKKQSCICKNEKCEKAAKRKELAAKEPRKSSSSKSEVCRCGTKTCKQIHRRKLSADKRKKYDRLQEKEEIKKIKKKLQELCNEDKLERRKQSESDKEAAKRLKKLRDSANIILCADALIDLIKYSGLTVFSIVRCLFKSISNPKLAYYKWRYQRCNNWRSGPGPLASMCTRMKTRLFYNEACKVPIERAVEDYNRLKKPKPKVQRAQHIQKVDEGGCSLFMSSLRKKSFLKVYYTCPWFYPHCIHFLKLGKNVVELLLFGLAVLVWSPCILCMESCRAVFVALRVLVRV